MQNSKFPLILGLVLATLLGVIASKMGLFTKDSSMLQSSVKQMQTSTLLNPPKVVPDFNLVNHHGKGFSKESLLGKHSILFFGFVNCPDICPQSLQFLKSVKFQLQQAEVWKDFQVVFISVDPARDTVDVISKYVPYFDQEFIGVTGSVEAIEAFTKALAMPFSFSEKDENGYYEVDHSASLLLTNPQGDIQAIISQPHTLDQITTDLLTIVSR